MQRFLGKLLLVTLFLVMSALLMGGSVEAQAADEAMEITLTPSTKEPTEKGVVISVKVKVQSGRKVKKIEWNKGYMSSDDKGWKHATDITKSRKFKVTSDGYYSVRVTDSKGINAVQDIDIENTLSKLVEGKEQNFEYIITKKGAVITKYIGESNSIIVPAKLGGRNVVSIAEDAFSDSRYEIKRIILPDGLKELQDYAIAGCFKLVLVKLPNTLTKIGEGALSEIQFTDYGMECHEADILIPESVKEIAGLDVLVEINNDKNKITVKGSPKVIPEDAFSGFDRLSEVVLPDGILQIKPKAFAGCEMLEKINLPDSILLMGGYYYKIVIIYKELFEQIFSKQAMDTLAYGKPLTDEVIESEGNDSDTSDDTEIESGIKAESSVATGGGYDDFDVEIAEGEGFEFAYCKSLKNIVLPSNLELISVCTFHNTGIEKIEIPKSVKIIGNLAFDLSQEIVIKGKKGTGIEKFYEKYSGSDWVKAEFVIK